MSSDCPLLVIDKILKYMKWNTFVKFRCLNKHWLRSIDYARPHVSFYLRMGGKLHGVRRNEHAIIDMNDFHPNEKNITLVNSVLLYYNRRIILQLKTSRYFNKKPLIVEDANNYSYYSHKPCLVVYDLSDHNTQKIQKVCDIVKQLFFQQQQQLHWSIYGFVRDVNHDDRFISPLKKTTNKLAYQANETSTYWDSKSTYLDIKYNKEHTEFFKKSGGSTERITAQDVDNSDHSCIIFHLFFKRTGNMGVVSASLKQYLCIKKKEKKVAPMWNECMFDFSDTA